jgi:hypothetical protein
MDELREAHRKRDYVAAGRAAVQSADVIPAWVDEDISQYGEFVVDSILAFDLGATILIVLEDEAGLRRLLEAARSRPELEAWATGLEDWGEDVSFVRRLLAVVESHPGVLQPKMKDLLGEPNGHGVATLVAWLEKAGRLRRVRSGRTHALYVPGREPHPSGEEAPSDRASRIGKVLTLTWGSRDVAPLQTLDLTGIQSVVLPQAPTRYASDQASDPSDARPASGDFELEGGSGWRLTDIQKLAPDLRPDPAFRHTYASAAGLFLLDDLGNAERFIDQPAALQSWNTEGQLVAEFALPWGAYRCEVSPNDRAFTAMSRDGVLHVYDQSIELLIAAPLAEAPEVRRFLARMEGRPDEGPGSYVRTVALSPTRQSFLFTIADQAWCMSLDGTPRWGLRLPERKNPDFMNLEEPIDVEVEGEKLTMAFRITAGAEFTPDWIYAASFAADGEGAWLAGYSGRIVHVDGAGRVVRVYETGSVPRRMADTGDFVYVLAGGYVYILERGELIRYVDVFGKGQAVIGKSGFRMLEKRRFSWFDRTGEFLGSVRAKDPLRRILFTKEGWLLDTRQQRARVEGPPSWWD